MAELKNMDQALITPDNNLDKKPSNLAFNMRMFHWLVDYELRSAERYRRFVALILMANPGGCREISERIMKTRRASDRCMELDEECAILMTETDLMGALTAISRYKSVLHDRLDVRFSMAFFPMDGVASQDLLAAARQRMLTAYTMPWGAVVTN